MPEPIVRNHIFGNCELRRSCGGSGPALDRQSSIVCGGTGNGKIRPGVLIDVCADDGTCVGLYKYIYCPNDAGFKSKL